VKEGLFMAMRIKFILAALLAAILLLTAAGCAGRGDSRSVTVKAAAAVDRELVSNLELSGVLVPLQSVDISSKFTGKVVSLGFDVGSAVKAGDILIVLDTDTLNAQLLQAQASLQSAEAAAESAQSQASLSKINLDAARKLHDRTVVLYEAGAVSQSQMDDITDQLNMSQYQYDNAAGPAQAQARAAISTALANINNYQLQIDSAAIRSPIDGLLTSRNVNVGQVVSTGVAVISIVDTSKLKFKSTVSQELLPLLSVGQEMEVTVDSYPDNKMKGTLSSLGPIAVSTGEVFPLEVTIDNSGGLAAGLSARAAVSTVVKGIVVPSSAVVQGGGESYVYVINDSTVSKRVVKVGLKNDQDAQIIKGLNPGEQVAVTNVSALSDKMPVTVN
jgi:RND family efflux transporter MFP subunit